MQSALMVLALLALGQVAPPANEYLSAMTDEHGWATFYVPGSGAEYELGGVSFDGLPVRHWGLHFADGQDRVGQFLEDETITLPVGDGGNGIMLHLQELEPLTVRGLRMGAYIKNQTYVGWRHEKSGCRVFLNGVALGLPDVAPLVVGDTCPICRQVIASMTELKKYQWNDFTGMLQRFDDGAWILVKPAQG